MYEVQHHHPKASQHCRQPGATQLPTLVRLIYVPWQQGANR